MFVVTSQFFKRFSLLTIKNRLNYSDQPSIIRSYQHKFTVINLNVILMLEEFRMNSPHTVKGFLKIMEFRINASDGINYKYLKVFFSVL